VATLAGPLAAARAAADAATLPALRLSGYGSLSGSRDNRDDLAPIRDISQRPADGHTTGATLRLDSRLAAQAAYRVDAQTEMVLQAVVRDQVDHSLAGNIELGYAEWRPQGELKLRGGRVGYDAFLMSDHRNLGYATTSVRPPTEFYGWIPVFSLDGVDATRDFRDDEVLWKLKAQLGNSRLTIPMGDQDARLIVEDLWSLTLTRDAGVWRLKAGLSGLRIANEAAPLAALRDGLDQLAAAATLAAPAISAEAGGLRRELSFQDTRIQYATLGASYDDGRWLVQAELGASRASHAIAPSSEMGYLLLGRRFGNLLPYLLGSTSRPTRDQRRPLNDWNSIGQSATQGVAYAVVNSTRVEQRTLAFGTRWDFAHRAALKLQWDHVDIKPQGYALWFRSPQSNQRRSSVELLTISLDFIF
ncbi:MAG TPA: hypothetical protein VFH22_04750, partial [Rhodocyclaceae bacterium]|nr:hypothetical protein [Rhodocyclaceae bacterium]